jgi:hypothetical protein
MGMTEMIQSVEQKMQLWAAWRMKREDNGLGYKCSGLVKGDADGSRPPAPYVNEAEMSLIDRAVCGLGVLVRIAVITWYCETGTNADKAMRLGISERRLRGYVVDAQSQIQARLGETEAVAA